MRKPVTITIPSRLARTTVSSPNLAVAQARSRSLYRDWYRAAPEICQLYALDVPFPTLRAKIRQIFDRYSHVKDVQAIDLLIAKSHMEYQEFVNVWKMPSQVMRYFESEQSWKGRQCGVTRRMIPWMQTSKWFADELQMM